MVSFFLVLECLNETWANFDFFAPTMLLYDRQGRKHGQFDDSLTHKNSIYSQYFALNSQCEACSFSVCDRMKHTFSFHRVSLKKSWNMRAKTEDVDARSRKVDQFAVVTARSTLGTWSTITSRVEGTKVFILKTMLHTPAGQVVCLRDWRKKDNSCNKTSLDRQTWSSDLTENVWCD